MKAKEIILDFINYLFILAITIFFFYFFVIGDRVWIASSIMIKTVPLGFFGIIFLVKLKLSRSEFIRRKKEHNTDITLIMSYFEKFKIDIVIFSLPIVIFLIAFFSNDVNIIDIIQSLVAFLIVFTLNKYIFSKSC